jgi:hypothetical protein
MIIPQLNESHNNSNQQFPFPLNPHIDWIRNIRIVVLGTPVAKIESSFAYLQMYIQFSSKFTKMCGYTSRMASSCSHVASSGL